MNILAIQFGHNATVSYTQDGELKYVLQEEKFDNIKNSSSFPVQAISYIIQKFNLKSIDIIAIASLSLPAQLLDTTPKQQHKTFFTDIKLTRYDYFMYYLMKRFPGVMKVMDTTMLKIWAKKNYAPMQKILQRVVGEDIHIGQIQYVDHHTCHALSPVYFYGLYQQTEPVLVFTLDGRGDTNCASVKIWENGTLRTVADSANNHSLGFLRSIVTVAMGMKSLEHEYKVMGLAAYTDEKYFSHVYEKIFKPLLYIDGYAWKSSIPTNRAHIYLKDKLYGLRFDNIAGALQYMTEKLVLQRIEYAVAQTGIRTIATSGGVFMNVKLNKRIQEASFVDKVYFMPSCGDESNVVGATFYAHQHHAGDEQLAPLHTMYSGLSYTDSEIARYIATLDKQAYTITHLQDDDTAASKIAELLAEFEIVGVMRGAGEWGARSLCNRAILANASDLKSFHTVNDMIKMRDFWMPFAPAILESFADTYIKDWETLGPKSRASHQFMISAVDSTPLAQQHLKAAMHQKDKTLRPQLVNEVNNPRLTNVLTQYAQRTGMGGIMNTSLNMHGYPLVGSLEQALFTLENSGMQHMLIGNYLLTKK